MIYAEPICTLFTKLWCFTNNKRETEKSTVWHLDEEGYIKMGQFCREIENGVCYFKNAHIQRIEFNKGELNGYVYHFEYGKHICTKFLPSHTRYGQIDHMEQCKIVKRDFEPWHPRHGTVDYAENGELVKTEFYENGILKWTDQYQHGKLMGTYFAVYPEDGWECDLSLFNDNSSQSNSSSNILSI